MAEKTRWLPLESNPDVMNKFITNLGVPNSWQFADVFGLDEELLSMVPKPAIALLLLFPTNEKYEMYRKTEEERIKEADQSISPDLYFLNQTISNACGTVALIHAIANNLDKIELDSEKHLKKFLDATKDMTSEERAKYLETDEGISIAHEESAQEGQTETPSIDDEVNLHFITLVLKEGELYELDGRKPFPINHGKTSEDTFLKDATVVCKEFMTRDPGELHFTMIALAGSN